MTDENELEETPDEDDQLILADLDELTPRLLIPSQAESVLSLVLKRREFLLDRNAEIKQKMEQLERELADHTLEISIHKENISLLRSVIAELAMANNTNE